jgi:hypothetical protein
MTGLVRAHEGGSETASGARDPRKHGGRHRHLTACEQQRVENDLVQSAEQAGGNKSRPLPVRRVTREVRGGVESFRRRRG